jgi:hypothetical protein
MVYLFLDFDGVTHPVSATGQYFREANLAAIHSSIDQLNVDIVITSTWRLDNSLAKIQAYLGELGKYVVGFTPEVNEPFLHHIRQVEVELFLKQQREETMPWVAVDDTPAFYRDDAPVIITDGKIGFTDQDAIPLRELIISKSV